ncbi:MAG TPA: hypothetical protein PLP23_16995 [Panacibacter sp.]|nr:hypothetical protein [Panacibacter sp.]
MKRLSIFVFIYTISLTGYAQNEIGEMKARLTGNDKTRWIFEKLQKTMGDRKSTSSNECIYSRIIFSIKDSSFFADKCGTTTVDKGKWNILKKDMEEYTIKLDKIYDIDFLPNRTIQNKERRVLRLRIPGKDMETPSLEYIYYAE